MSKEFQAKLLGAGALLAFAGTYAAARIDFSRRHRPGIPPASYWSPQLTQIWLPGLAAATLLTVLAWWAWRRRGS